MLWNCGVGEESWESLGQSFPSLEGLMLKVKLQYFGHLMWKTDSSEKTLMMGGEGDDRGWDGWMASQTLEAGDGQGRLAYCSPWGRKESDMIEWLNWHINIVIFWISVVVVQLLSRVWLFVTAWTASHQASLSITISQTLLKLMSIELVMPSNHLILCHPPSPPALNLFQPQGLFQWVSSLHHVGIVLELQLQHQTIQWIFRTDFL